MLFLFFQSLICYSLQMLIYCTDLKNTLPIEKYFAYIYYVARSFSWHENLNLFGEILKIRVSWSWPLINQSSTYICLEFPLKLFPCHMDDLVYHIALHHTNKMLHLMPMISRTSVTLLTGEYKFRQETREYKTSRNKI